MSKKICVMGAGSWGLALALLLDDNHHEVTVWCYSKEEKEAIELEGENKRCLPGVQIPKRMKFTTSDEDAIKDKDIVVIAIPSEFMRENIQQMAPFIKEHQIIVNVSKGLEYSTLSRLSEVIQSELPNNPIVVLSGPSHAEEVSRRLPTTVTVSSQSKQAAHEIQTVFMTDYFRVYTNPDLMGVELGAALKNVIAFAAGALEGMGYGDNTKAALMTRGLTEITRLGVAMGANQQTFSGLSGIGDLIVTCTSPHSRNRYAGELIGKGYSLEEALEKVNMVVEGVHTAKGAYLLKEKYNVQMPIITAVYKTLFEGLTVKDALHSLMVRDKKDEHSQEDLLWQK
ncbi:MAG TPA: NAD(P)H-dependent glycerol-3-phosphate dehydrogenase [Epulopiscium sp.]|nr:NAD(P)H-dependent glycerol-3-phosphate dehydrogenase [Candidatus Epulonipiscium sp.]